MLRTLTYVLVAAIPLAAIALAHEAPPRTEGGQTLVIPDEQLDRGIPYYVMPGDDLQLCVRSDTAIQRLGLTHKYIVGYMLMPFDRAPGEFPIAGGAVRIPLASLDISFGQGAQTILGPTMLNAAEHPEMTFVIDSVSDAKRVSGAGEPGRFEAKLNGWLGYAGKELALTIPVTVALTEHDWANQRWFPGELMSIKASFDLTLEQLGFELPRQAGKRFTGEMTCDLFLVAHTVSPERRTDFNADKREGVLAAKCRTYLRDFDDVEKAAAAIREYAGLQWDDANALNTFVYQTVSNDDLRNVDLALMAWIAERANELTEHQNAMYLDTLALVRYKQGRIGEAVKFQTKAVQLIDESVPPPTAEGIRAALTRYEAAQKAMGDGARGRTDAAS